jgi:hypothetical protein
MTRFELAASSSRTKRATGLRYIPFFAKIISLGFSTSFPVHPPGFLQAPEKQGISLFQIPRIVSNN